MIVTGQNDLSGYGMDVYWKYVWNSMLCMIYHAVCITKFSLHMIFNTQIIGFHFLYFSLFSPKKCAMVTWQKCIHSFYPNNNIATVLNSLSTNIKSWFQCSKWCDAQWNMAWINCKTVWLQPHQEYDTSKYT